MTRLSWNEIKLRAINFARENKAAHYEKGETQTFYNEFFNVFGITRRRVASFEEPARKLGDKKGFIDLFWKGNLIVEHKSAGRDLSKAYGQALDYFPGIDENDLPRFVLVSDFQNFVLHDLETDEHHSFTLSEFPTKIRLFAFMLGLEERKFEDQDPVNIKASAIMGRLHDALYDANYRGHDLELLLIRLLFCLFADDTGIFPTRSMFQDYIDRRTSVDGHDLGTKLAELFQVLNEPETDRQNNLDQDLAEFPYVNGDLFEKAIRLPSFNSGMRQLLIEACRFDWEKISPAIFGALFQSVLDPEARRKQGAHYTSEKNILKVIEPLFLDDLRSEFKDIVSLKKGPARERRLEDFHLKLADLKFFDPACGCGNFLIIAYREIRKLEHLVIAEIYPEQQRALDLSTQIRTSVDQFYGIEIDEFPSRIAEVALYMMDHIMNNEAANQFGDPFPSVPIKKSPHIHHADALELDWNEVIPPKEALFIFGNPPFGGSKPQHESQRSQVRRIANLGKSGGTLDYVAAWFILAAKFVGKKRIPFAFVATNSITQGEQVAQLWPQLINAGFVIHFAHRTFVWHNDARKNAKVHCVIIGQIFHTFAPPQRILFSYESKSKEIFRTLHEKISPYLIEADNILVKEVRVPVNGAPRIISGSKPIDGGHFIFSRSEMVDFLSVEPDAHSLFFPFIGTNEYIYSIERFILNFDYVQPET